MLTSFVIMVTDIFLLKNSATPPRIVMFRLAQCKRKSPVGIEHFSYIYTVPLAGYLSLREQYRFPILSQ
jgi:hypothetical protein